jgi:hypothetical protein
MWEDGNPARLTVQPPLSTIAAKVGAEFRGAGASVLDLAWPVAKYSAATGAYLGLDPVHFTPEGHRFAALAILKHLAGEGLLPGIGVDAVANLASQRDDLRRMAAALQ